MRNVSLITISLILAQIACFSQSIQLDEIDDFTGSRKIITSPWRGKTIKPSDFVDVDKSLLVNTSCLIKDSITLHTITLYLMSDIGCLSKYDGKAIILFEDKSKIEIHQLSDTDCDDSPTASYLLLSRDEGEDKSNFQSKIEENYSHIMNHDITKIRVYGNKYYKDFELNLKSQDILKRHFSLIGKQL